MQVLTLKEFSAVQLLSCACADALYLTVVGFTMWVQYKCTKKFFKPSAIEFGLLWWLSDKGPACQCRRHRFTPWSWRSLGEGNGNPHQYSCWEISWTEEPGGLQSTGPQKVGYGLATEHTHMPQSSKTGTLHRSWFTKHFLKAEYRHGGEECQALVRHIPCILSI